MIAGLVGERLEEIRRARAQRTVGVGLESADAKKRTAKRMADADLHLIVDARNERCGIDARGQFAALQQFVVDRQCPRIPDSCAARW